MEAGIFSSYMRPIDETPLNDPLRLLETDTTVILPFRTNIRVLVTADDVIHS